jgi:hypothetical protein
MKKFIFTFCLLSFLILTTSVSGQLTYPTRYPSAVIPHNNDSSRLFFLYLPMQYENNVGQDTFKLYYVKTSTPPQYYLARSIDYGITWTDTQKVIVPSHESIIKNPNSSISYLAYNVWSGDTSFMYKAESSDGGFNFSNTGKVMELGEDKSFIWNEDTGEYWGYVRPYNIAPDCKCWMHNCFTIGNGVRKIALMKNSMNFPNSGDWSARNIIVEIDTNEYINSSSPDYRTQTYYMQVFRNDDDWWGLVGMYRVGNNGGETNDVPYTYPEYTSDVELMWSDDGEKWYRTNNRQPFIALHDSINTIYSVGTVVDDSIYIYSSESTLLHASYSTNGCANVKYRNDTASYTGKFYSIYLYKIGIDKLNEWRPPSKVKLTATIEGFLNTGTGKLNLRDTLPAELRNSTSPYGLVASSKSVIDSVTFKTECEFPHVNPGNYYLSVSGRNSIETWSSSAIMIYNDSATTYNFTTGATKAYGSNLILKDSLYCIYSGDVNKDDFVDNNDIVFIYNNIFLTGYYKTDLDGNLYTDMSDVIIASNNSNNLVSVIRP